jgi:hypothetical protein
MESLQPHKNEYWLFPKIVDWDAFVKRVELICTIISTAVKNEDPNLHVLSVDEKSGIQAIERYEGTAPKSKGSHKRQEHEYERYGTSTLIAATNVASGGLTEALLNPTRDEKDFGDFTKSMIVKLPEMDKIIILLDQLNTHLSETLVRFIAEEGGYALENLGVKGKSGILKSQQTRKDFLECEHHRIRFVFTPKHCSWLNPIENWFSKLQRHVIKNGNFKSVKELEDKIKSYIAFYNEQLAKTIKWKFKGFAKNTKLHSIVVNNL